MNFVKIKALIIEKSYEFKFSLRLDFKTDNFAHLC